MTARWRSGNGAFGPCWNGEFNCCCGEEGGIGGGGWNGCCANGGANVGLQLSNWIKKKWNNYKIENYVGIEIIKY